MSPRTHGSGNGAPPVMLAALILGSAILQLAVAPAALSQGEDFRTRQLMQDVAELKRVVRQQEQRIDQLERQVSHTENSRGPDRNAPRTAGSTADRNPQSADALWLNPKNWDRVKTGMAEKQVIELLGYPTSARTGENGTVKTLFYTLEVGPTGFLSGHVELENGNVRALQRPALK